jgi:hypothetical protein
MGAELGPEGKSITESHCVPTVCQIHLPLASDPDQVLSSPTAMEFMGTKSTLGAAVTCLLGQQVFAVCPTLSWALGTQVLMELALHWGDTLQCPSSCQFCLN